MFDKILIHSGSWDEFCKIFPVKKARNHYLATQYLFSRYYIGYNKFEEEVSWLLPLVTRLEKEKEEKIKKNKQLEATIEKKVEELNKYKEQVEDLVAAVKELLLGYSELSEEDIEKDWQIGELEELLEKIEKVS